MTWDRRRRLEAQIKEKVAIVVTERLSDPRLGFLTVTRVELSRDKKICRIYYTVLGKPAQRRATARALESAAPHIQEVLGPRLKMRTVPELRFTFDEQIERESRMRTLLEGLAEERGDPGDVAGGSENLDDLVETEEGEAGEPGETGETGEVRAPVAGEGHQDDVEPPLREG